MNAQGGNVPVEPAIEVHDLTVAYAHKPVLWDIDVAFPRQSLVAIVGPNGAGKSTLLKAIVGLVPLASGYVRIFGKPFHAQYGRVAYVPQRESVDWDFPTTVLDVVMMGRYKPRWFWSPLTSEDKKKAYQSLERMSMSEYAHRQISQLSGGQQQRVFLARALAQEADIYLLDEPFAGIDATTEHVIVQVMRELRENGATVVAVHHDLQTVPEYFDHVMLLNLRCVAFGTVDKVFTAENIQATYGGHLPVLTELGQRLQEAEWRAQNVET
jgi:manganese/zinc/iron transport system ATP- binding protein